MRPTPRTQPYRRELPRMLGPALQAMLEGRQPGQLNPADFDRARVQQRAQGQLQQLGADRAGAQQGALQQLLAQRMQQPRPRATADIRGGFTGEPDWTDPHLQRMLAMMLGARTPTLVR